MKRTKMVEVLMTDRAYQLQRGNLEMADSISDTSFIWSGDLSVQ